MRTETVGDQWNYIVRARQGKARGREVRSGHVRSGMDEGYYSFLLRLGLRLRLGEERQCNILLMMTAMKSGSRSLRHWGPGEGAGNLGAFYRWQDSIDPRLGWTSLRSMSTSLKYRIVFFR